MHDTGKLHPTFLTILHPKSLKEINMELTIIETSAYLELKRQLSTLSVQMEDLSGKWLHRLRTNEWMRRRYAWRWESRKGVSRLTVTGDWFPAHISAENISTVRRTYSKSWKKD